MTFRKENPETTLFFPSKLAFYLGLIYRLNHFRGPIPAFFWLGLFTFFPFHGFFPSLVHGGSLYIPYDENMPTLYRESFDLFGVERRALDFQLRKRPESINNLLVSARNAFTLKDLEESERLFRKILKLNPGHTEARTSLATILSLQSRGNEAMAVLESLYKNLPVSEDQKKALLRVARRFDAKVLFSGWVYDDGTGLQKSYFRGGYQAPSLVNEKLSIEPYAGRFGIQDLLGSSESSEVGGILRYFLTDGLLFKGDFSSRQFSGADGESEWSMNLDGQFGHFTLTSRVGSKLLEESILAVINQLRTDYVFLSLGGRLHDRFYLEQTLLQDRISDGNIRRDFNTLLNYTLMQDGAPLVELRLRGEFFNTKTELPLPTPFSSYFSSRDYSKYGFDIFYQRYYRKKVRLGLNPEIILLKYKYLSEVRDLVRGGGRAELGYRFNRNSEFYISFESTIRENHDVRLLNASYNYDF